MINALILVFLGAAFHFADAQSVGQLGASAVGGSAAGVAGKTVSEGLNSVGGVLDGAAKTGKKQVRKGRVAQLVEPDPSLEPSRKKKQKAVAETPIVPMGPLPAPLAPRRVSSSPRPVAPVRTAAAYVAPPTVVPEAPRVLLADALPRVEVGASRKDLVDQLGRPAGRITSVDERGLVEVYSFREGRTHVGSVRLVNGKVSEIKLAQ